MKQMVINDVFIWKEKLSSHSAERSEIVRTTVAKGKNELH